MVEDVRCGISPFFGRPGSTFKYRPKNPTHGEADEIAPSLLISVAETPIYMLFAHRQWRAGMLLADAIYARCFDVKDRTVLELGAGTGVPALTAALCGARKVC